MSRGGLLSPHVSWFLCCDAWDLSTFQSGSNNNAKISIKVKQKTPHFSWHEKPKYLNRNELNSMCTNRFCSYSNSLCSPPFSNWWCGSAQIQRFCEGYPPWRTRWVCEDWIDVFNCECWFQWFVGNLELSQKAQKMIWVDAHLLCSFGGFLYLCLHWLHLLRPVYLYDLLGI